ncbi:MAG: hypothetical protein ABUT39_20285, partial [Acidobacteriota bacterium]
MRYGPFLAALLVTALPLSAQEEPKEEDFGEVIDVRVVNVEAVVTSRDGDRVRGLSKDDFRLLVDGREVPIEFFNEVVDGAMVNGEPSNPSNPSETPAADAVGRSVLVYIDDSLTVVAQRNIVLDQIEASLTRLSPRDQVAIAAYDAEKLERLLDWTSDRGRISAALAVARVRGTEGLTFKAHALQGFPDLGERVSNVVNAAASAMRGLPAPPGRKVMLLLAGGWPLIEAPASRALRDRAP